MSYFAHPESRWGYPSKDGPKVLLKEPSPYSKRVAHLVSGLVPHVEKLDSFERGMVLSFNAMDLQSLDSVHPKLMRRLGLLFIKHCLGPL